MPKLDTREAALIALADAIPPLFFKLRALAERAHAHAGISAGLRALLRDLVQDGPATAPDLAARRHVSRQAVQPMIDELIAVGLAEARANPRHKRSHLNAATPKGVTLHGRLAAAERAGLKRAAQEVNRDELIAARDTLLRVAAILNQHFPDAPA
jgi:DNA-binding MarR family transcriptional regulator